MTVGDATSAPPRDLFSAERAMARARSQVSPGSVGFAAGPRVPTIAVTYGLDRVDVPRAGEAGWGAGGAVRWWKTATCSAGTAALPSAAAPRAVSQIGRAHV